MDDNASSASLNLTNAQKNQHDNRLVHILTGDSHEKYNPWADKQRRSLRHNTRKEIQADLARFQNLASLTQGDKLRLRSIVRHHLFLATWTKFRLLKRIHQIVLSFGFALIPIAGILAMAFSYQGVFGDMLTHGASILLWGVSLSWGWAFNKLGRLSWIELSDYLERMRARHRYWWVGPFFYFAAVYVDPGYPYHPNTAFGVMSSLVANLLAFVAGAWTGVHALVNLSKETEKNRLARIPDSYIVAGYLRILFFVDDHPACLRHAADKCQLLALLEQVASIIQHDLPKPFHSNSSDADVWFQGRSAQMATAVRNLKTWILTPKADTLEHFTARIAADMSSIATGEWDSVPMDASKPSQEKTIWVRFGMFLLRVIIWSIFVLLAAHAAKLDPHWVSANYTSLLIALPIFVTLSERFDPAISPLISSYKETLKTMQEIGKKSEH